MAAMRCKLRRLQQSTYVYLPFSPAAQPNREPLLAGTSEGAVSMQGRQVAQFPDSAWDVASTRIQRRMDELNYRKNKLQEIPEGRLEITVMVGKAIRYRDSRRAMRICVDARYRRVHFALEQYFDATGEGANG